MCDAAGDTIETEKTLIAVARQDWGLPHPAYFFKFAIPIPFDGSGQQ
jgi:hypothetical protein